MDLRQPQQLQFSLFWTRIEEQYIETSREPSFDDRTCVWRMSNSMKFQNKKLFLYTLVAAMHQAYGANWNGDAANKTQIRALLTSLFRFLEMYCKYPITKFDNDMHHYYLREEQSYEGVQFPLCVEGRQRWEIILSSKTLHTAAQGCLWLLQKDDNHGCGWGCCFSIKLLPNMLFHCSRFSLSCSRS